MLRNSKPWFFENSKIPTFLSNFAPINISAITIGPLVFSGGEMSDVTKNHEAIHWQQYIETGIIGFSLLYYLFYAINYIRFRGDGKKAYFQIPFEREAYTFDQDLEYLSYRKRFSWINFGE